MFKEFLAVLSSAYFVCVIVGIYQTNVLNLLGSILIAFNRKKIVGILSNKANIKLLTALFFYCFICPYIFLIISPALLSISVLFLIFMSYLSFYAFMLNYRDRISQLILVIAGLILFFIFCPLFYVYFFKLIEVN